MATILTPPDTPAGSSRNPDPLTMGLEGALGESPALLPHLLLQLEDDLERSRLREAFWISVAVHLLVVIFLGMSPHIFPGTRGVVLINPADLMRDKQLTYLDMPPDMQKAPKEAPPEAKLSDKNRIAMSRHPEVDKKTLEELRKAGPPRPESTPAPPAQSAQASPPPVPQGGQQAPQQQNSPQQGQQMAQLEPVPQPKLPTQNQGTPKFPSMGGMMTPGQQIAQAARSAASTRTLPGGGMAGGQYGAGPGGSSVRMGNVEVLTDTQGVDFGPYLTRVLDRIRMNWYVLIPEAARAPLLKRGKVSIEFVILPNGNIAGLKLDEPSGDASLDRAAWGGITASNPFAPLPNEFHGPYLGLRIHFFYNPAKGDMQ